MGTIFPAGTPKTPHAGIENAARGNAKRRTRKLQSPHAAFEIPLQGVENYNVSFLQLQRVVSAIAACRICNYSVSLLLLHQADVPTGEEQLLPNIDAKVARQDFVRPVVRVVSHAIEQGMRQAVQSSK